MATVAMRSSTARARDEAFADAFDEAAQVLVRLAARLRAAHASGLDADTDAAPGTSPGGERALGARQVAVLGLAGLDEPYGMSAREVADALGYQAPNATNLLKGLEARGHLVRLSDERPARWRTVPDETGAPES